MSRAIAVLAVALSGCTFVYSKDNALNGRPSGSSASGASATSGASSGAGSSASATSSSSGASATATSTGGSGTSGTSTESSASSSSTTASSTGSSSNASSSTSVSSITASSSSGSSNTGTGSTQSSSSGGGPGSSGTTSGSSGSTGAGAACPAGVYFCDDFESDAGLSSWDVSPSAGGNIAIDTQQAHDGTHALHFHVDANGGNYINEFAGQHALEGVGYPIHFRAWVYATNGAFSAVGAFFYFEPAPGGSGDLDLGPSSSGSRYVSLGMQNLPSNWTAPSADSSTTRFLANAWTCVEWEIDAAPPLPDGGAPLADAGSEGVSIGGTPIADLQLGPVTLDLPDSLIIGWDGNPNSSVDVWFDDVAIGATELGCP